jgi:adenylate kinase
MYVILLGPPGVGKGTQGVLLADALGWERVVTGDLLRQARTEGTALGQQAQQYMDRGELVPDEVMIGLVREKLAGLPPGRGVVFDGFPRTEGQASALSMILTELQRKIDSVVVLTADDDLLVQRISGRASCPQCGSVYNVFLHPPRMEGQCDKDGARLTQRADDHPETVRHRLEVYRQLTEPLIAYYQGSRTPLRYIDGDGDVEEIQHAVRFVLGLHETG